MKQGKDYIIFPLDVASLDEAKNYVCYCDVRERMTSAAGRPYAALVRQFDRSRHAQSCLPETGL